MQRVLYGIGEYFAPVLRDSKFKESGVITPDEFVAAGDYLTYKCPTWKWAGSSNKAKSYLPADKQYLITRNVPCIKRVCEISEADVGDPLDDAGFLDWVEANVLNQSSCKVEPELLIDEIPDMEETIDSDTNDIVCFLKAKTVSLE